MRSCLSLCLFVLAACLASAWAEPGWAGEDAQPDARQLFAEALRHEAAGRATEARGLFAKVVELEPDHPAARRALGYVQVDGAWIGKEAALDPLGLVRVGGEVTLARHATRKGETAAHVSDAEVLDRQLHALESGNVAVRVRAAKALGTLKDERALPRLVRRWELSSGDFQRCYFAGIAQRSYLRDFDVEVSKTSFIADPIVGTLQSGVVQDVKVLSTRTVMSTVERTALHEALVSIAGEDAGKTHGAWRRWLNAREEKRLAATAK